MFKKLNIVGGFLASLVGGFSVQSMEVERFSADQKSTKTVPEMLSEENRIFNYWALEQMTGENFPKDVKDYIAKCYLNVLGKPEKLDGDFEIYVGSGFSDAGEPIFFGMERLDDRNYDTWSNYEFILDSPFGGRGMRQLYALLLNCNKDLSDEMIKSTGNSIYVSELREILCGVRRDKLKITLGQDGVEAGLAGSILKFYKKSKIYVTYASSKPVREPFQPKKILDPNNYTLMDLEYAYGDLIVSVGVKDNVGTKTTTHRGIFKNPFYDIHDTYKYISLKLHGFAGAVAKNFFEGKEYMLVSPTENVEAMLRRKFSPGEMFLGTEGGAIKESNAPYAQIPQSELGGASSISNGPGETLHTIRLDALSEFYNGNRK